jgi:hypothetical protein
MSGNLLQTGESHPILSLSKSSNCLQATNDNGGDYLMDRSSGSPSGESVGVENGLRALYQQLRAMDAGAGKQMYPDELLRRYAAGERDFQGVLLGDRTRFCYIDLSGANLAGVNLSQADLAGIKLGGTNLCGANLVKAKLDYTFLMTADLRRADLREADLTMADLQAADLRGANLSRANLRDAMFSLADLRQADLRGANLSGADFDESLLSGAIMPDGAVHD